MSSKLAAWRDVEEVDERQDWETHAVNSLVLSLLVAKALTDTDPDTERQRNNAFTGSFISLFRMLIELLCCTLYQCTIKVAAGRLMMMYVSAFFMFHLVPTTASSKVFFFGGGKYVTTKQIRREKKKVTNRMDTVYRT